MVEFYINKQTLIDGINNCEPVKIKIDEISYIDSIIRQYTDAFVINETTIYLHCTQQDCAAIVRQIEDYLQKQIKVEFNNKTTNNFRITL